MKNSKNSLARIKERFAQKPNADVKAWLIINDFYHCLLSWMEKENISKAELARRLGKSRSFVSKMFNGTPNISLKKIVEIAYKLGLEIELVIKKEQSPIFQVEHIQPVIIINKNIPLISEDKGIPKINEKDIFIETIKISDWKEQYAC